MKDQSKKKQTRTRTKRLARNDFSRSANFNSSRVFLQRKMHISARVSPGLRLKPFESHGAVNK
jgi:hypothetical protein